MLFRRNKRSGPPPLLMGHVDSFANGRLSGWICNHHDHGDTVAIEIRFRGEIVSREPANRARPDVNAAGIAGDHGYEILLPPLPSPGGEAPNLTARCGDTVHPLDLGETGRHIADFFSDNPAAPPLPPCSVIWGEALERESVALKVYEDAVYRPIARGILLDHDLGWGLYDRNGDLIPEAAFRRGADLALVGQSPVLPTDRDGLAVAPFETMIYGGPLLEHYGHFLLSTLSRRWALDAPHPVLFHATPTVLDERPGFIDGLLRQAGLEGRHFSFARPTRIPRLIVPEPGLTEQHSVWKDHARALSAIGEGIASAIPRWRKVYLSKSRLPWGVNGLEGEAFIDLKMRQAGFTVVHPETLSLAEQVGIFRQAELIAGLAGSAFHTLALAPQTSARRVIFTCEDFLNSNFLLLDRICGGSAGYFSLKDDVVRTESDRFTSHYSARQAHHLAEKMIALAR